MTVDIERRLASAAADIHVDVPSAASVVAAGRRRTVRRGLGLVAVVALVGTASIWAVTQLVNLRGDRSTPVGPAAFDSSDIHLYRAPYGAEIPVPNTWVERGTVIPDNVDMVLSTTRSALDGAIQGCGPSDAACSTRPVEAGDVGAEDAFVQVWIFRGPCNECTTSPLPEPLRPSDFVRVDSIDGQPVMEVRTWVDDGTSIQVRFWTGPETTEATQAAAEFVVRNLHLPEGAEEPQPTEYVDPQHRFRIALPADWNRAKDVLTPRLASPYEIFAAGTYRLRSGGEACLHFPVNAMEDLGTQDVLVWIAEAEPFGGSYPRPEPFPGEPPDPELEARYCLQDPDKPYTQWWIPFSDGNRSFYVLVAMGNEVTDERRAETWRMLDSFDPEPSAPATPSRLT